ncbi:MAG: patatin-like phospholipase family protein [Candidatus Competibacteraceae bacterium]
MHKRIGLVLTGGGARAGYQAGVLKGIAEIVGPKADKVWPFQILVGTSAGAINSAFLASTSSGSFTEATTALDRLWSALTAEKVVRSDVLTLTALGLRWLRDLSLGGLLGNSRSTHLLDASPLWEFLSQQIDFTALKANLQKGALHGLAISATNYLTGSTVIFFDGAPAIEPWVRSSRVGIRTEIALKHVLASAAIPVFFQPVKLNGAYYGDGCVRLTTPLSPAMHLGADRVLAIGIRHRRPDKLTLRLIQSGEMPAISLVDIAGVMLNAAFLDALDTDIERMQRINKTIAALRLAGKEHPDKLREVPLLVLSPSQDLGTLASEQFNRFSNMLRYLLKGIGASTEKGWDLLSYLAFDEAYTGRLLELGYQDALAQREVIQRFLE